MLYKALFTPVKSWSLHQTTFLSLQEAIFVLYGGCELSVILC